MSDLNTILGLAGVQMQQLNEWNPTPDQEKWLGGANRQDPYILWRMPGKKPPISYFKDPEDQELAKAIGYVEKPAPVVDRNPPDTATTAAAPKPAEPSKMTPLDKPAVTRAAPDTRSKGAMTPLDAEPTASDIDPDADGEDMNFNPDMRPADSGETMSTAGGPPQTQPTPDIDPDADGEDMNTNPDMTPAAQAEPEDDSDTDASYMARPDGDSAYGPYASYDDMMKARANPVASADNDRGTSVNKMRDTMNMFDKQADADAGLSQQAATNNKVADFDRAFGKDDGLGQMARANNAKRDTANRVADFDRQFKSDGEDYSLADRARDNNDIAASNAEIAKLNKQLADLAADNELKPADQVLSPGDEAELAAKYDRDAELQQAMMQDNGLEPDYQQMGPDSVKSMLNKALATEPKVDMDAKMPSGIKSGEDLYKALDGNLNWLDKNIK